MTGRVPASSGALRFVDLHTHSTASDGAAEPNVVVAAAAVAGLTAVALTDHDTLAGVATARAAGERMGVRVIAGVELSAVEGGREVHVLALHVERADLMEERLEAFRAARRVRAEQIVEKLNALGVPLTLERVLAAARGGAIGRPHVARALIEGGWVRDARDAFDRYLGAGRPAFVEKRRLSVADAIELTHASGGIAVLAHPGSECRRQELEPLVAVGLDGVEVLHPSHSAEDVARFSALVDFFGLVPSGGSDWHGASEGARALASQNVPFEWLERQEERVASRRAQESVA